MAKVEITPEFIRSAMQHPGVVKQLRVIADRVKTKADALAASEDVEFDSWVVEKVRPGGRPVAQVYVDNVEQEFGTKNVNRYRILGRAAQEAS